MISRGLIQRRMRQAHFWLGAVIGAQVLLWLGSGLFMELFSITDVRGDHLRAPQPTSYLSADNPLVPPEIAMAAVNFPAEAATLRMLHGEPAWIVVGGSQKVVVAATTGQTRAALDAEAIKALAAASYAGRGTASETMFLEEGPQEVGSSAAIWAVDFGPRDRATLYLDPTTGETKKVRTPLWRAFDFAWGLHIMDWSTRSNFNSWWIRATAVFSFVFGLAGAGLVAMRLTRRRP